MMAVGVEFLVLSLLLAAAFVAVPLATLVHVELATARASRHVDTFAELAGSRFEEAGSAPSETSAERPHLRLVYTADNLA